MVTVDSWSVELHFPHMDPADIAAWLQLLADINAGRA